MPISILFWVIFIIWILAGVVPAFPRGEGANYWGWGGSLLLVLLVGILGWQVFGSVVK